MITAEAYEFEGERFIATLGRSLQAQLSCKPDWFRLPKPLRDEINAAYPRRRANPLRHVRAIAEASRWYRANPREDA